MVKHLLIIGLYQTIVMFVIIFAGDHFIPEESNFDPNTDGKFVYPGRPYKWNGDELYKKYSSKDSNYGASRHYTVLFNVFVFMQIFNMINWRKINDEYNIFSGIHKNKAFIIIISLISVVQFIIVQFTRDVFSVCRQGLTWYQWLLWIGIGLTVFPVCFAAKLLPDKLFPQLGKKKRNPIENSGSLNFRRKRTVTLSLRQPRLSIV